MLILRRGDCLEDADAAPGSSEPDNRDLGFAAVVGDTVISAVPRWGPQSIQAPGCGLVRVRSVRGSDL